MQKLHFEKRLIKMELIFLTKYEIFIKKFDQLNEPSSTKALVS